MRRALKRRVANPAWADDIDRAKRIHDRIAGVPPDATTLSTMESQIGGGNALQAALDATEHPSFYNVTLKNFAAPWTNREGNVFVPLNDYIATIIGMVRDDWDFREILSADVVYVGSGAGIPAYSANSNAHYEALEAQAVDLHANLQGVSQASVSDVPFRRRSRRDDHPRRRKSVFHRRHQPRDVPLHDAQPPVPRHGAGARHHARAGPHSARRLRSPGGDSRIFLNNCIGCHSGMDPLAQAFAYYDYEYDVDADPTGENGQINYNAGGADVDAETGTRVESKYFNNDTTFAPRLHHAGR